MIGQMIASEENIFLDICFAQKIFCIFSEAHILSFRETHFNKCYKLPENEALYKLTFLFSFFFFPKKISSPRSILHD